MTNRAESVLRRAAEPTTTTTAPAPVSVTSTTLTIIAAAAVMALLYWAREVFIPIVLSVLISYALEPIVAWLTRLRLSRLIASGLVVAAVVLSLGYITYSVTDDVSAVIAELPEAAAKLRRTVQRDSGRTIQDVQRAAQEFQRAADAAAGSNPVPSGVQRVQIEEPTINLRQYVSWGSASAVAFAGQATLVVFFVFFLLASGDLFKRKLVTIAGPSLQRKKITLQILDEINLQIERFLIVRLLASIVVGLATWIAFRLVGLEQAAVWGLAAGVFNSIPYFGPVVVAAGTAIVAFLQFGTVSMALYVSGLSLVITSLEGWLLTPWLTSRTARTNEVAMFVALIFWSFVWGIWGTLLAVPLLVTMKAICDRVDDLKPLGELLGE